MSKILIVGNVLKDIIRSHCFNIVKLSRIFRQAAESDIIVNAHTIDNYGGDGVMTFEFTVAELKGAIEIKLYKPFS